MGTGDSSFNQPSPLTQIAMTTGTNPKDAVASAKPNLSRLPLAPLLEVIAGMEEGASKYGPWNWRAAHVNETIYADAAIRHLMQWLSGEDIDPDSGLSHISKAVAGLLILRDAQIHGCSNDDRQVKQTLGVKEIGEKIGAVHAKYADPTVEQSLAIEEHTAARAASSAIASVRAGRLDGARRMQEAKRMVSETVTLQFEGAIIPLDGPGQMTREQFDESCERQGIRNAVAAANEKERVAKWSVTVAGNGSYEIKQEDDGKRVQLRNGDEGKITNISSDPEARWPVEYTYNEEDDEGCEEEMDSCSFNGNSCCGGLSNQDNDIVKVYHH